jgi:hypothetical protein
VRLRRSTPGSSEPSQEKASIELGSTGVVEPVSPPLAADNRDRKNLVVPPDAE